MKIFIKLITLALIIMGCRLPGILQKAATPIPLDHPLADRSFVSGIPCEFPCWYGLEVDQSTIEDVRNTLNGLDFVNQASIFERDAGWDFDKPARRIDYKCVYPTQSLCGYFILHDNTMKNITTYVYYPLTLEDVIEKVGEPEYLYETAFTLGSGCILSLFWPELMLNVDYGDELEDEVCSNTRNGLPIERDLQVTLITYRSNTDSFSCSLEGANCIKWPGFVEE